MPKNHSEGLKFQIFPGVCSRPPSWVGVTMQTFPHFSKILHETLQTMDSYIDQSL